MRWPRPGQVLEAATAYKKALKGELDAELAPFLDDRGRPEDVYRGAIRRIETRFARRERRAERDFIDRVLLAASALLRDRIVAGVHGGPELRLNVDRPAPTEDVPVVGLAACLAASRGGPGRLGRGHEPQRPAGAGARVPAGRLGIRDHGLGLSAGPFGRSQEGVRRGIVWASDAQGGATVAAPEQVHP